MVKVKICGITNQEDALLAVKLGADALGFIFAPSPRRVTSQEVKRIVEILPPFVDRVGVFVNERASLVKEIAEFCSLTTLQFHGDESPRYCSQFPHKIIKSFSVTTEVPRNIFEYRVDAYLLDTFAGNKRGGTGKTFDWKIARKIKESGFLLILSGGLTPDNVKQAIREVNPYAVDVAGGVEAGPGKKSPEKLSRFIQEVKELK